MSNDEDYLALLDRAKTDLPETIEAHERFELPELDIIQEGKITILRNFMDIADKLRREPEHLLHFLLREFGTPGEIDNRRAIFKAKISSVNISERLDQYTDTYVICAECARPDTKLVKYDRTLTLECEACGAGRPISVRKTFRSGPSQLKVGDIIEITVTDVGKKGDGLGKYNDLVVIVPGTTKGARVHARITNISNKTAFGQVTNEAVTR
ncbi:MAG TPA: translation initiation factor IF-2 subunit beta [Candidatus Methanomethylophilaceae archaeon]|nr:translation initiation factor IF-2 subunit beta [Candidatus Methanomethylophilaceae archaeon]